ncbi:MAG: HAD-IA family hydrolase [Caulobacteraceae bacterium]
MASAGDIEAVIWDFGGVFTTSPFEAFNAFEAERGFPKDLIRRLNATNPDANAWALFERGEIDRAGFDRRFLAESSALGCPIAGAEILPLLAGAVRPRMVAALKLCKTRFKAGCITNNMAPDEGRPNHRSGEGMVDGSGGGERAAGIMALFDVIIESSKAGVRKPDPAIYRMMCEALGVEPSACVYLDDLGINCKPAATLGMKAIKVVSEDQTLTELAEATGLTFSEVPLEAV